MSNPTFPGSLPQALEAGYLEEPANLSIATQMDAGPAKLRARSAAIWSKYKGTITMTASQWATFKSFWQTTCAGGAVVFDWKNFDTGATKTYRFAPGYQPKRTHLGGLYYKVDIELEDIPS